MNPSPSGPLRNPPLTVHRPHHDGEERRGPDPAVQQACHPGGTPGQRRRLPQPRQDLGGADAVLLAADLDRLDGIQGKDLMGGRGRGTRDGIQGEDLMKGGDWLRRVTPRVIFNIRVR